jgi:ABC-type Co2+ transport system permease subunit
MAMNTQIFTLAGQIAERRLARYGRKAGRKLAVLAAAGCLALTAAITACGFLIAALWAYARPIAGPVGTPLIFAAVCAVLALILALVAGSALRHPRRARRETLYPEAALALEAQNLVRKQKLPILLTAALIGLLAGSQKR